MTDRPLNVYHMMLSGSWVQTNQRQITGYVAAKTQIEAAGFFGVKPNEVATWGGTTHNKGVQEMCRAEPGVVFLSIVGKKSTYVRKTDYPDETKEFQINERDEEVYGKEIDHPAFGQITVARVHGYENLFMVDYPVDHYLTLEISTAGQNLEQNLPYFVAMAEEKIDKASGNAKAEINAHADYVMQRLGERALGDRLQQALEAGTDTKLLGRNIAVALDEDEDAV